MNLEDVTPLIITKDEIANIDRIFRRLHWAKRVVVVDSFSTDGTVDLLAKDPRVVIKQRPFDGFAQQCSFGLDQISSPWVLSLDADYYLTDAFIAELKQIDASGVSACEANFLFSQYGKILRSCLYPSRFVLFRKGEAHFQNDGHGHVIVPSGKTITLKSCIIHDDRKPFSRWWKAQGKYAEQEVLKLRTTKWKDLSWPDRLRSCIFPAPGIVWLYTLFYRGLILDGWPGLAYAGHRVLAELVLSAKLLRDRLGCSSH